MTTKRFTRDYNGDEHILTHFLNNGKPMTKGEVLNQLNKLYEENEPIRNQLNNFILHSKDLKKENELLKEALREELQDNGNSYYIDIFDKLFDLNYREWVNNRQRLSKDWEEELQLKEFDLE